MPAASIYDISARDYSGTTRQFSEFKGNVLLIVNVASTCGLARQSYSDLSALLSAYHSRGLRILLFPCKQFLNQEHSELKAVKEFAEQFHDEFILMDMVNVRGREKHPLYEYLIDQQPGFLTNGIKWNFTYFLIGRDGKCVRRYGPTERCTVEDKDVKKCIGNAQEEAPPRRGRVGVEFGSEDESG